MKHCEIKTNTTYTDGKGALRRVICISPNCHEMEYKQHSGRNAGAIRRCFLYTFAEWARAEV